MLFDWHKVEPFSKSGDCLCVISSVVFHNSFLQNSFLENFRVARLEVLSELINPSFACFILRKILLLCREMRVLFSYIRLKSAVFNIIISHHDVCSWLLSVLSLESSLSNWLFLHSLVEQIKIRFHIWHWVWISTWKEEWSSDRFWSNDVSIFIFLQVCQKVKEILFKLMWVHLFVLLRTFLNSICS